MIAFEHVSLEYAPANFGLRDVSFSLEPGSFTFLTGHSGAGKSSLLKLIARLEKPTAGDIQVGDIRYSSLKARHEPHLRRQMGIVFQDNQLLNDRNVFDNIALPLIIGGFKHADIVRRVNAALNKVGLSDKASEVPISLSGGEQQRIGIARAVVARPKLLLADEPTGNLDATMSAEIMSLLMQFNSSGVTVLLATHDTTLLDTFKYPRLTLEDGRMKQARVQRKQVSRV
ncbi:MAG: cell division ATP-binding protein FtsE [Gammaproteobacteria bacterium]|nr:cell division ATP-binding protein FtsE [Gammaproteobacteria bacterium]